MMLHGPMAKHRPALHVLSQSVPSASQASLTLEWFARSRLATPRAPKGFFVVTGGLGDPGRQQQATPKFATQVHHKAMYLKQENSRILLNTADQSTRRIPTSPAAHSCARRSATFGIDGRTQNTNVVTSRAPLAAPLTPASLPSQEGLSTQSSMTPH